MNRKECYICHEEIQDNNNYSISVTNEHGKKKETYYLCSRECFSKLIDKLKDHEPEGYIS